MRRRGEKGFTLVETLVSLTLLALIATVMFGGLRFGARAWETVEERTGDHIQISAARAFLEARLSSLSAPPSGDGADFEGSALAVRFSALWTNGPVPSGTYDFALSLSGGDLVLGWRGQGANETLAGSRALLTGAEALSFSYHAAPGESEGATGWRRDWSRSGAPKLVRLDLAFADPARIWAPLIIRRGL